MAFVQIELFFTDAKYDFRSLHKCSKKLKTENQKTLRARYYLCRSHRENTDKLSFFPPLNLQYN